VKAAADAAVAAAAAAAAAAPPIPQVQPPSQQPPSQELSKPAPKKDNTLAWVFGVGIAVLGALAIFSVPSRELDLTKRDE
jgi:hypothetical protein